VFRARRVEKYLERPRCESCGIGKVRPINVVRGEFVLFGCSNRLCRFTMHAELPPIHKKVIYLDTSIDRAIALVRRHP
jgi:hypothetical protein